MGQRTATLVSYIDEKGVKTNTAYYNQWGIGRVQLNAIMGNFLAQIGQPKFDLSGTKSMLAEDLGEKWLNSLDFTNPKDVEKVIDRMDNNDGGIVIVVDEKYKEHGVAPMRMAFLIGWDEMSKEEWAQYKQNDPKPYSNFVTFEEWKEKVGSEYVDDNYTEMFLGFCRHFKVEFMKPAPKHTYKVTRYYHSNATVFVEATSENEAKALANKIDVSDQIEEGLCVEETEVERDPQLYF